MATPNYNLPTISGNQSADVVRDMNALAEATDGAIKTVDTKITEVDGDIAAVDTALKAHIKDDLGHTRHIGNTNASNAWVCTSNNIVWEDGAVAKPKQYSAYRVTTTHNNTGNVTLSLKNPDGSKVSSAFPVVNSDGSQIQANSFPVSAILTVVFYGNSFFLQGSGSGVIERGSKEFTTPGTYSWVVPRGVYNVLVVLNAAGGGGGGFYGFTTGGGNSGGGGGSGGLFVDMLPVTPGETIPIIVGMGGSRGADGYHPTQGSSGGAGGRSSFKTYSAYGGDGGQPGSQYGTGAGGTYGTGSGYGGNGQSGQSGSNGGAGGKNPGGIGDGGNASQNGKDGKVVIKW